MSQGLIRRLTVQSQYEEALVKINATAAERLAAVKAKPQATIQRDMLSICSDPFTVAQQLTHIELVRTLFRASIRWLTARLHSWSSPQESIVITINVLFDKVPDRKGADLAGEDR